VSGAELAKFPLLAQLAESEREAVADELEPAEFAAGIPLFREGEPADGAWFVAEGRVRVHVRGVGVAFGPGEVLGTLSLVVDGPREASAETLSHTRVWRLSRNAYRRLVAAMPATACRLLEGIVREHAGAVREEVRRESAPRRRTPVDPVRASD
jgi:CRP-like cAMP-binding protein